LEEEFKALRHRIDQEIEQEEMDEIIIDKNIKKKAQEIKAEQIVKERFEKKNKENENIYKQMSKDKEKEHNDTQSQNNTNSQSSQEDYQGMTTDDLDALYPTSENSPTKKRDQKSLHKLENPYPVGIFQSPSNTNPSSPCKKSPQKPISKHNFIPTDPKLHPYSSPFPSSTSPDNTSSQKTFSSLFPTYAPTPHTPSIIPYFHSSTLYSLHPTSLTLSPLLSFPLTLSKSLPYSSHLFILGGQSSPTSPATPFTYLLKGNQLLKKSPMNTPRSSFG
jgi:hypothetical protein